MTDGASSLQRRAFGNRMGMQGEGGLSKYSCATLVCTGDSYRKVTVPAAGRHLINVGLLL